MTGNLLPIFNNMVKLEELYAPLRMGSIMTRNKPTYVIENHVDKISRSKTQKVNRFTIFINKKTYKKQLYEAVLACKTLEQIRETYNIANVFSVIEVSDKNLHTVESSGCEPLISSFFEVRAHLSQENELVVTLYPIYYNICKSIIRIKMHMDDQNKKLFLNLNLRK